MIVAKNIYKTYKNGSVKVINGISVEIEDGSFTVISGASGSGKSTLMSILSGLERPDSGKILYGKEDITILNDKDLTKFRRANTGFIFQQYYLLSHLSVDKNVKMGADLVKNSEYREIINAVGLEDKLKSLPNFREANNSGSALRAHSQKSRKFYFWTSRQALSTRLREEACSII